MLAPLAARRRREPGVGGGATGSQMGYMFLNIKRNIFF